MKPASKIQMSAEKTDQNTTQRGKVCTPAIPSTYIEIYRVVRNIWIFTFYVEVLSGLVVSKFGI